ncbi:AAA family ATPase [Providencia alcalifaciens]|uniref:AAA family ATPase n=2 Tax=Enterobacterales TaxID=91347 RepID=UPI00044D1826|nr:AAA family ATPase [Providencia alcalifaciens]ETT05570.1 AAA domain protein [Providencia alcalifaciens F90-2004]EUC94811.1 AAA domain protein [Providencia alcalifaciens PAL-2]MTB33355.1 AAA family ATPase [Providencia alcalifaciens]MTD00495.1 AAA family ATPase [Providencia alcalifaciens]
MLIIFSGLPGSGKSTIAQSLAKQLNALYLRIDTIEQAIRKTDEDSREMGPAGYFVAYSLARENLQLGATVIADSVNPLALTRDAYREIALSTGTGYLEIEIICSDIIEHRKRVETRVSEVEGLTLPDWIQVTDLVYEPWNREHLVLDSYSLSSDECVSRIIDVLSQCSPLENPLSGGN